MLPQKWTAHFRMALKFWEGPAVVIGVVVIPGLLAAAMFLMPFLDRRFERKIWRRPIPALAVTIVVLGMIALGVRSRVDDSQAPTAQQLAQPLRDESLHILRTRPNRVTGPGRSSSRSQRSLYRCPWF
jgi:hypothetical protein